jgi:hypothetical protein
MSEMMLNRRGLLLMALTLEADGEGNDTSAAVCEYLEKVEELASDSIRATATARATGDTPEAYRRAYLVHVEELADESTRLTAISAIA